MEHIAWKGRIKPGYKAEYQRRHAEIWPEMVKVLKEAGICNYSIFTVMMSCSAIMSARRALPTRKKSSPKALLWIAGTSI